MTPGVGYSVSQTVPAGWDLTARDVRRRQPGRRTSRWTRARSHLHVHGPEARPRRGGRRRGAERRPGLLVHGRRRARRRRASRSTTTPTATLSNTPHAQRRADRHRLLAVRRSLPAGWDQASATCSDGSPIGEHQRGPGRDGHLHLHEPQARPDRGRQGRAAQRRPGLRVHGRRRALARRASRSTTTPTATLSNTRTFTNVAAGLRLLGRPRPCPSGWYQSSAICSDGSPVSNIGVAAGETVTCTFVNTQARADRRRQGRAARTTPQDFSFTAGGGLSPASFQLDDDSDPHAVQHAHVQRLAPGSGYSLSETVPSGWDQSSATCDDGSPVSNIDVSAGETVTCTFVNKQRGQIVVVKDAMPERPAGLRLHGRRRAVADAASSSTTTPTRRCRTRSRSPTWRPAPATRSRRPLPAGWELASATCNDGSPVSNIDVGPNETVTCTFVNQQATGRSPS